MLNEVTSNVSFIELFEKSVVTFMLNKCEINV